MSRPTREELTRALAYFEGVLKEEADAAALNVLSSFQAGTTTLDQVAEGRGVAEGIRGAAALLGAHVAGLKE